MWEVSLDTRNEYLGDFGIVEESRAENLVRVMERYDGLKKEG